MFQIRPIKVKHSIECFGFLIKGIKWSHIQSNPEFICQNLDFLLEQNDQTWSIVYSGDTRPCNNLIKVGRRCDLLIHEATFADEDYKAADLAYHRCVNLKIS